MERSDQQSKERPIRQQATNNNMSSTVWLVTVPNNKENAKTTFTVVSNELKSSCELYRFKVPGLTVGTLDTLIALSDDLSKISQQVEVSLIEFSN